MNAINNIIVHFKTKNCLIYVIAIFLSSHYCTAQRESNISIIEYVQFIEVVKDQNIQLIDVRTSKEYNEGYIAMAKNIPIKKRKKFKTAVQKLDKEKPIYVYCYSGVRSKRSTRILRKLGFKSIYDYRGGWKEWSTK